MAFPCAMSASPLIVGRLAARGLAAGGSFGVKENPVSSLKFALPAFLALSVLPVPSMAQQTPDIPIAINDGQLVYEALGQRLSWPLPDWLPTPAPEAGQLGDFISSKQIAGEQDATLELFPRGESEAYWTTIYGARINATADIGLPQLRRAVVNVYSQACKPQSVALFQFEPDEGDVIPPLGFLCGSYLDQLPAYAGKGEIMVIGFVRSESGVGMVYQEWRGAAFDPEDTASWPVSPAVVEARVEQFKSAIALSSAD